MAKTATQRLQEDLQARLKQAQQKTAASFVPRDAPKKTPKKEEETPSPHISDLGLPTSVKTRILNLTAQYVEIQQQAAGLEKRRQALSDELKGICREYEIAKAQTADVKIAYYSVPRRTIKADRLLALGVAPKVIQDATEVTESWQLRVTELQHGD